MTVRNDGLRRPAQSVKRGLGWGWSGSGSNLTADDIDTLAVGTGYIKALQHLLVFLEHMETHPELTRAQLANALMHWTDGRASAITEMLNTDGVPQ